MPKVNENPSAVAGDVDAVMVQQPPSITAEELARNTVAQLIDNITKNDWGYGVCVQGIYVLFDQAVEEAFSKAFIVRLVDAVRAPSFKEFVIQLNGAAGEVQLLQSVDQKLAITFSLPHESEIQSSVVVYSTVKVAADGSFKMTTNITKANITKKPVKEPKIAAEIAAIMSISNSSESSPQAAVSAYTEIFKDEKGELDTLINFYKDNTNPKSEEILKALVPLIAEYIGYKATIDEVAEGFVNNIFGALGRGAVAVHPAHLLLEEQDDVNVAAYGRVLKAASSAAEYGQKVGQLPSLYVGMRFMIGTIGKVVNTAAQAGVNVPAAEATAAAGTAITPKPSP